MKLIAFIVFADIASYVCSSLAGWPHPIGAAIMTHTILGTIILIGMWIKDFVKDVL